MPPPRFGRARVGNRLTKDFETHMNTLPALFAMRTSIGAILIVMAIGLVLGGIWRVISDAIAWYRDEVRDPYRDLRKEVRERRKTAAAPDSAASANRGIHEDGSIDGL